LAPPPPPINRSKVLAKPHTGKEKPHPSTATEGSKPCVTKCRRPTAASDGDGGGGGGGDGGKEGEVELWAHHIMDDKTQHGVVV